MPIPPWNPGAGRSAGCASRFTSMTPLAARTLCECMPFGTSIVDRRRGFDGSLTSTIVVPSGACMWAMKATVPSTTTCPPPAQSK